ncbi:MAG: hypothetical protein HY951_06135 [Bacteroidia bacterium]|nr:hypothetical protein [Bacteroidia bacterium]
MTTKIKIIHWLPRILCILAILFLELFALDSFDNRLTLGQQLLGFIMHSIPALVLTGILFLAWKKEFIGGIIFILIGAGFSPFIYSNNYAMNHSVWISLSVILLLNLPFIVTGGLFIISNTVKKKAAKVAI